MSVLYVAPLLPELPADPTPGDLYSHIIELRIIADRVSYEGAIAVMELGSAVMLGALCAIAAPLPDIPIPSVNPDDVMPCRSSHGITSSGLTLGIGMSGTRPQTTTSTASATPHPTRLTAHDPAFAHPCHTNAHR